MKKFVKKIRQNNLSKKFVKKKRQKIRQQKFVKKIRQKIRQIDKEPTLTDTKVTKEDDFQFSLISVLRSSARPASGRRA